MPVIALGSQTGSPWLVGFASLSPVAVAPLKALRLLGQHVRERLRLPKFQVGVAQSCCPDFHGRQASRHRCIGAVHTRTVAAQQVSSTVTFELTASSFKSETEEPDESRACIVEMVTWQRVRGSILALDDPI